MSHIHILNWIVATGHNNNLKPIYTNAKRAATPQPKRLQIYAFIAADLRFWCAKFALTRVAELTEAPTIMKNQFYLAYHQFCNLNLVGSKMLDTQFAMQCGE